MSSTNQSPAYQKAEQNFLAAQTKQDKLYWLEEMIKECPKHKSAEKMLANLKTRYKKLKSSLEKNKAPKKTSIRKASMQALLIGPENTGKSTLFNKLIGKNKSPTSNIPFTTYQPILGTLQIKDVKIQLIDMPPLK
ncbi:MAG: GTPase, partial [Candidatus Nanoarchaeia archaeon]